MPMFQYPRYRIVECIVLLAAGRISVFLFQYPRYRIVECIHLTIAIRTAIILCFNIRAIGSWNASRNVDALFACAVQFQYPRYRIVECIRRLWAMQQGQI